MLIPLTNSDLCAEVDDEFADVVLAHKWRSRTQKRFGDRITSVYTKPLGCRSGVLTMHHLVHGKPPPGMVTDHIDGDPLNNKLANLRHCTNAQNQWNARGRASTSGFKGVRVYRSGWRGQIRANGKTHYSNMFHSARDAALWVMQKRAELHGSFARHF